MRPCTLDELPIRLSIDKFLASFGGSESQLLIPRLTSDDRHAKISGTMNKYIYIYIYIYRRLGGRILQDYPTKKSVSVSFRVRVVRACVRAKLRERVSDVSAQRWRQKLQHFLLTRDLLCAH